MTLDWPAFTPGSALTGGLLIGFAAAFLALTLGRVAGISGILGSLLVSARGASADRGWRIAFLVGLVLAPAVATLAAVPLPPVQTLVDWPWLVLAGLLVGLGTRIGSGCTSGHGVCGLARGSLRSLAATLTFMAFGVGTVWLFEHALRVSP